MNSYVEKQKNKRQKINNILEKYVKKGLIKDYDFAKYNYWQGVPYILLNNGNEIILAKTFYTYNSLAIKTIYDYNINYVNNVYLKNILKYQNAIKEYNIRTYGELLTMLK